MSPARIGAVIIAALLVSCVGPLAASTAGPAAQTPEWFGMQLTDVMTHETFMINDFTESVVLIGQ